MTCNCDLLVSQAGQRCAALGDWARASDQLGKCLEAYRVLYLESDKKVVNMKALYEV